MVAPALELVRDCVRELAVNEIITDRVARYPSPTVLIDGHDVMDVPGDGTPVDARRLDVRPGSG